MEILVAMNALLTVHFVLQPFGSLLRLGRVLLALLRGFMCPRNPSSRAKVVSDALLRSGGLYAKVGQYLSMRTDLFPRPMTEALSQCHDRLPPRPFENIRQRICKEIGIEDISEVFEWIEEEPISSATIAQVHRGRLQSFVAEEYDFTRDVAIKVRHENVKHEISIDLWLIKRVINFVLFFATRLHALRVCWSFLSDVERELNLAIEAENMEIVRGNLRKAKALHEGYLEVFTRAATIPDLHRMSPGTHVMILYNPEDPKDEESAYFPARIINRSVGDPESFDCSINGSDWIWKRHFSMILLAGDNEYVDIMIPQVFHAFTSERILVMSFEEGSKTRNLHSNEVGDERILRNQNTMLARAFAWQIFRNCFAHGDPHPGNVLFRKGLDQRPVLLDFGLCRAINKRIVLGWCKVVYGGSQFDWDIFREGFFDLGFKLATSGEWKDLSEDEQMEELSRRMFPVQKNSSSTSLKMQDVDKGAILDALWVHNLVSGDLLFIFRIINYIGHLSTGIEMRSFMIVLPRVAEMTLRRNGILN